jgi:hypothetical protein
MNPDKIKQRQLARLQQICQLTQDQQTKITPVISNFVDQLVAVRRKEGQTKRTAPSVQPATAIATDAGTKTSVEERESRSKSG